MLNSAEVIIFHPTSPAFYTFYDPRTIAMLAIRVWFIFFNFPLRPLVIGMRAIPYSFIAPGTNNRYIFVFDILIYWISMLGGLVIFAGIAFFVFTNLIFIKWTETPGTVFTYHPTLFAEV